MKKTQTIAIALLVIGILGLAYGGFSSTIETRETNIGAVKQSDDREWKVNMPMSLGAACVLLGGIVLVWRNKL